MEGMAHWCSPCAGAVAVDVAVAAAGGEEAFPGHSRAVEAANRMVELMDLGLQALSQRQVIMSLTPQQRQESVKNGSGAVSRSGAVHQTSCGSCPTTLWYGCHVSRAHTFRHVWRQSPR